MKYCKIYADPETLEPRALEQFMSAMQLDCVLKGALMPDAHTGYSLPIGAVVETEHYVFPSWVGYDIGCGMCAIPTRFRLKHIKEFARSIHEQLHRDIPTGFSHHSKERDLGPVLMYMPRSAALDAKIEERKARFQLGTLGGGNHFVEVGSDDMGFVWIVIHSGSRGVGHGTAEHYMRLAAGGDKAQEGHYGLHYHSDDGVNYLKDVSWCLQFALENRKRMLIAALGAIAKRIPGGTCMPPMEWGYWSDFINRNHNHVEVSNAWFTPTYIHRKGATHAEAGMMGVIPGNMRDGSFIVRGKGNPESLCSSSHGAGRVMSRKQAKGTISLDRFTKQMDGIVGDVDAKRLDEAPDAYKNIFDVMEAQLELVDVVHHVKPILNVKG